MHTDSTLHQENTRTLNGLTDVLNEKVKKSNLNSLQFEMQLDKAIHIAHKCLTGSLALDTRVILFKDDFGGQLITFSADKKPGHYYDYSFNLFLTRKPCPDSIPQTHPNFVAAIALSGDNQETWELNLYRVTSKTPKSKALIDSITNIGEDIVNHIETLIKRVIIFIQTLVLEQSNLSPSEIDEDSSIKFSNVKRMVYEHGGDKERKIVAKFFVEKFQWSCHNKTSRFALKDSAIYLIPMLY
jgi:hypothetical protein